VKEERARNKLTYRISTVCKVSRTMSWFWVARGPDATVHVLL